jgi:hypothetical protein
MENTNKDIRQISFWKRSIESVERVESVVLSPNPDKTWKKTVLFPERKEATLTVADSHKMLTFLSTVLASSKENDQYLAYRYENNQADFSLKFFLEVDYTDYTYKAIKGLKPFAQPNYKEIVSYFQNLIK